MQLIVGGLALLFVFFCSATAQTTGSFCLPNSITAFVVLNVEVIRNDVQNYTEYDGSYYYDASVPATYYALTNLLSPQPVKILTRYDQNLQYIFDDDSCTYTKITDTLVRCANASITGPFTVAANTQGSFYTYDHGESNTVIFLSTPDTFPVVSRTAVSYSDRSGGYIAYQNYFDITTNPIPSSVWIPPSPCTPSGALTQAGSFLENFVRNE